SWGGRFVVIIMPLYDEVVAANVAGPVRHDQLAARLRGRGVEVIDTVPAFAGAPDPADLYLMRRANSPSAAGHRLLADYITAQLTTTPGDHAMLAHGGAY